MLSIPDAGWSMFHISDDHQYNLSYLTDVADEWLENAIHGLRTLSPFAVHGYCEPGRMVCMVSYYACYVVFEGDGMFDKPPGYRDLYGVGLSMIDFCRCLYKDIHDNLDEWVHWALHDPEEYDDPEDAELQRNAIDERRKTLRTN